MKSFCHECYILKFQNTLTFNPMVDPLKPITRVRHSSDLAYIDESTGRIINENYNVEYQEPYNGIVPNNCCGHKPYHTDIRCCDEKTNQFINYKHCDPDE